MPASHSQSQHLVTCRPSEAYASGGLLGFHGIGAECGDQQAAGCVGRPGPAVSPGQPCRTVTDDVANGTDLAAIGSLDQYGPAARSASAAVVDDIFCVLRDACHAPASMSGWLTRACAPRPPGRSRAAPCVKPAAVGLVGGSSSSRKSSR